MYQYFKQLLSVFRPGVSSRAERIQRCCEEFRAKLEELNRHKFAEMQDHINAAISNFVANVKYRFVDGHGPRVGKVTAEEPLMWKYDIATTLSVLFELVWIY